MKSVAIVILNWNGKSYLQRFLPSVVERSFVNNFSVTIVVADNGSSDGSIEWLKKEYPQLKLIEFDTNHGFTGGYNLALKQITSDYYLLLNSDVQVEQNWLLPLLHFMENNPEAAACMPKILDHNNPSKFEYAGAAGGYLDLFGYPFCRGRILNVVEEDKGQYNDAKEVFWATGACLLVRSKEFWEAKGLDTDFFAHMEEIDLCWRLKRQGYSIWCIPQSVVYHVGGGTLSANNPRKVYYNHRNNLVMLLKNLSRKSLIPVLLFRLTLDWASALMYALSGKPKFTWSVIRAHLHFYRTFTKTVKKRIGFKQPKISLYPRSILIQFFIKRRKVFSSIHQPLS